MMRRRRLTLPLAVSVAVLATLVVLGGVVRAPPPLHAPVGSAAAVPSSQLVRKYPLGERRLCCGPRGVARDTASPSAAVHVPRGDSAKGAGGLEWLVLLLALTLAAALGSFARRFTRVDGAWVRVRQRRRLRVGPTVYRWAQSFGFRSSDRRGALVLRALGGRFGPVLTLRPHALPPPRPQPTERAPLRATVRRPFGSSPACTIDVAIRLLPLQHRGAQLWQLTAVDLRSHFVWAELVRRRSGPPTAPELSAFLRRIAGAVDEAGEHLDAIAAPVRALPVLDGVALPAGARLIVAEAANARTATAADIHELLVVRHWRTAFIPPAAPSLEDLRRRLQTWVAGYNAQRSALARHADPPGEHQVWCR
jgi:hypothetical protein